MSRNIASLPLDVLENIFHHIDEAKDLLCLALTTKNFSEVIIPSHLQLRKIRCLTNTTAIWSNLASRPGFCARIREIHLCEQFQDNVAVNHFSPLLNPIIPTLLRNDDLDIQSLWPRIPRVFWETPYTPMMRFLKKLNLGSRNVIPHSPEQLVEPCSAEESSSLLCHILPQVVNLTKFLYTSSSLSRRSINLPILKSLLDTITHYSSCSLQEVSIVWYGEPHQRTLEIDVFSSLWTLSHLTVFQLELPYIKLGNKDVDDLCNLLVNQCRKLEKLSLNFETNTHPTHLDGLWARGTWKHLHNLCLGGNIIVEHAPGTSLFGRFIEHHPGLQCLEYHNESSRPLFDLLRFNLLKNLRALSLDKIPYPPSLSIIMPHKHRFENVEYLRIRWHRLTEMEKDYFPSLRVLIIHNIRGPQEVSNLFPKTLERLCVSLNIYIDLDKKPDEFVEQFIDKLVRKPSPFDYLTHLCIVAHPRTDSVIPFQSKQVLKKIATLRRLKYFGLENPQGEASQAWIRLNRDSSGRYTGYAVDNSVELVSRWWQFLGHT